MPAKSPTGRGHGPLLQNLSITNLNRFMTTTLYHFALKVPLHVYQKKGEHKVRPYKLIL
jgi:hypothetical protein